MDVFRPSLVAGFVVLALGTVVAAQQPGILAVSSSGPSPLVSAGGTTCKPLDLQTAPSLTFRQRACYYEAKLMSPSFAARAVLFAAFGQLRNEPYVTNDGAAQFTRRFAVYYARRTGQSMGELMAGYLNHEDPRYHPSHAEGFWNRSKAALLSVAVTRDADGGTRPALGPIAGSFGSGMIGVACYRTHNSLEDGFRRTGFSYGGYLGTALFREFKPDITDRASRFLHKRSHN